MTESGPGPIKVSVIVTVFNTGERLREIVASLDAQSLAGDEFEVLLVDDGSTDDTLALARDLASTRPNLVVETIPNSGWPGRPRNVGIGRARGEYVFFADHDDRFGPRALERLYDYAATNGSDIVYGKIVRVGRSTPYWPVWARDEPAVDIAHTATISRTVHKLYRREFLNQHELRFAEGRVRVEDHLFMAAALPKARVVSVLASEPCYWWIFRKGDQHISEARVDPSVYWHDYTQVLATFERAAGPGELLDSARVVTALQAFTRFAPKGYLARTAESRQALFAALHPMFRDHVPPELDSRFPVYKRLRVQALRAGDQARFDRLQQLRGRFSFGVTTDEVTAQDGRLRVVVSGRCVRPARPEQDVAEARDGQYLLRLGSTVSASEDDRRLLDDDLGGLEVSIRHRASGVEWPVHTQTTTRGPGLRVVTEAVIDLTDNCFGAPLDAGNWDLVARLQFLGELSTTRVGAPAGGLAPATRTALPDVFVNDRAALSFAIGGRGPSGRPRAQHVEWRDRRLVIDLPDTVGPHEVLVDARGTANPRYSAVADGERAVVDLDLVPGEGLVDFWVRDEAGTLVRLGYGGPRVEGPAHGTPLLAAYATLHGSLSVTRARTTSAPSAPAPPSRLKGWLGETARRLRR